ncbi:MAG: GTP cyclohydrolase II, partial [Sulfurimonas sp.]
VVTFILDYFKIKKIKLLTNNPHKVKAITGVDILERIPIIMASNKFNEDYLDTKRDEMGHLL